MTSNYIHQSTASLIVQLFQTNSVNIYADNARIVPAEIVDVLMANSSS